MTDVQPDFQTGYDSWASAYAAKFPDGYTSLVERHAIGLFSQTVLNSGVPGQVVDVGCGNGHITHGLRKTGLDAIGVDPSQAMLGIARNLYPAVPFTQDDALLATFETGPDSPPVAAVLARYSLIHVDPAAVPQVFERWARLLAPGATVMVAFQANDTDTEPVPFDHRVAPAWLWHPNELAALAGQADLGEVWRLVTRPDPEHRFP